MMQRRLRWKRHLRAAPAGPDAILLVGDGTHFLLRGRAYAALGDALDGRRTVAELLVALGDRVPAPELYFALQELESRGYVYADDGARGDDPRGDAIGFWQSLGSDAALVATRLRATPVALLAIDGADVALVGDALVDAGVTIDPAAALRVAVTDDYLHAELAAIDRDARAAHARWMPLRTAGVAPWIGPMFGGVDGACWHCLAHRLRWNRPVERWLAARDGAATLAPPPRVALRTTERLAADLAALTLAWWIADGGIGAIDDHLLAFSLTDYRAVRHRVARRPQCAACGDPTLVAQQTERPVVVEPRPRPFTRDGGHRTVAPDDTVARLEPLVSPITGLVASVGPVSGRDHPLRPVYGAVYRITPVGPDPGFDDFHRMSSGKGRTPAQAQASALCEALERISAIADGDEVRLRAPLAALSDEAIHPDALQNFSAAQLARPARALARDRARVPLPYDPSIALDWTPAWSLSRPRRVLLPTAYCYQHTPSLDDAAYCVFNPNGHAAGNCREEAILQAFLELVERDAIALWWYARTRQPAVELDAFDDPYFPALRAHYASLDARLTVLDLTTDLAIPAFVALAERPDARFSIGFGCHLDARLALQRALTELNQIFDPSPTAPSPWPPLPAAHFLSPDPAVPARTAADYLPLPPGDLRDDLHTCLARAAAADLDVLVLDQSRPDIPLAAVKVVAPGLRHFWPRLGPGRLYTVPLALGRIPAPLREDDLNPIPLLL